MTKAIITDDEPLAAEVIKNHLQHFEDIEVVAVCNNAIDAGNVLRTKKIDLMFLDIEMPKISGFEFLSGLKNPPKIIIVTAYRNYALKGYEYDIVDYLLKPVSFDRFYQAINKYYKIRVDSNVELLEENSDFDKSKAFLYVNEDKTIHKLYLKDLLYIESYREYVKIHTAEKSVMTKIPISRLEKKLEEKDFVRIHKSYIVSVSKINSFNARHIHIDKIELPIGRTYKNKVMEVLNYNEDLL